MPSLTALLDVLAGAVLAAFASGVAAVATLPLSRPSAQVVPVAAAEVLELAPAFPKGDRLPLPLPQVAPAAAHPALDELSPVPLPSPPADNLCTRHHGIRVETNGGRFWHCVYKG